jgi:hypothetical protein
MIDPALIPLFGIKANIDSTTQLGSYMGFNNINIPYTYLLPRDKFIDLLQ